MVLIIYTKNASNLTNRYRDMVPDGRTTPKLYSPDFVGEKKKICPLVVMFFRHIKIILTTLVEGRIVFKLDQRFSL